MKPHVLRVASVLLLVLSATPSLAIQSDDFSAPGLNTGLWRFFDPVGDASYTLTGTNLQIVVPAGVSHNLWSNSNRAPRLLQAAANGDFGIEAKFDSQVGERFQMQGLVVQETDATLLRFDAYSDQSSIYVFAAYVNGGSASAKISKRVTTVPAYLRVTRTGNNWNLEYSSDGTSWQSAGNFNQTLNVSEVGLYAANHGYSAAQTPAFTGDIDYFFDTANPIVPEDGGGGVTTYALTVGTVGSGSVSRVPNQSSYAEGAVVQLTAVPSPGWTFAGWSGDLSGSANPATLTMPATAAQVTATFVAETYTLSVGVVGTGSVTRSPNQPTYSYGDIVQLTAVPGGGQVFQGWSGAATGSANPTTVTITGDASVTATFGATATYTLSVSANGSGTVTKTPNQATYTQGQVVTVTAAANSGWAFNGWSGDLTGSVNPTTVTMNGNKSVTATFSPVSVSSIQSDDFHSQNLNTSLWRFEDPLGEAQLVTTGTNVLIDIPGGIAYDLWNTTNYAPRLLQAASNNDFGIEIKFDSTVEQRTQGQGLIVVGNAGDFLRTDVYHDGSSAYLFAAYLPASGSGAIKINTPVSPVPSYLRLERSGNQWTYRYSFNGSTWQVAATFTQAMTVTEAGFFVAAQPKPALVGNVDYFFNMASRITLEDAGQPTAATPPAIEVWYGDNQNFGGAGNPQTLIQVMGRVWDTDDVTSLSYRLNGGSSKALAMGVDGFRLVRRGEFNIEIDNTALTAGANSLQITAIDEKSEQSVHNVTLNYTPGVVASLPRTLTWQGAASVPAVAQVVDGHWHIEGDGVRTNFGADGYDRLLVAGDYTWTPNYEVVMPVTVHSIINGGAVGIALGWQGHTGSQQPKLGHPYEAIGWVTAGSMLQMLFGNDQTRTQKAVPFAIGTRYLLKMRSQTLGGGSSEVRVKWWQDGTAEPSAWDMTETLNTINGSVLLIAHLADATIGRTVITPLSGAPEYVLTTNTAGNGSVTRNPNQSTYASGTPVALTAVPSVGWTFTGWSGALSSTANPATVTVTANTTVTATFVQDSAPTFALNLTVSGDGTATRNPDQSLYSDGQQVTLTASANPGSGFVSWSGDLTSTANPATATVTANMNVVANFAPVSVSSIQSDDFGGSTLNASLWRFFDPLGDGSYAMTGTNIEISMPGGVSHNLWGNSNWAPRLLQPAPDSDFDIEAKFDSPVNLQFEMQGIVVQESDTKLIRFDVFRNGSATYVFAGFVNGGSGSTKVYKQLTGTPSHLRVTRTGSSWNFQHSTDGVSWQSAVIFTQALNVTEVGVFGGNHGYSPAGILAFTASIDHFFNVDNPIVPQDGPAAVEPPLAVAGDTPPTVRELAVRQNFPNPFKAATTIEFGLPEEGEVTLRIYDVRGRRVFERRISSAPAGWTRIQFDGRGLAGAELPGGVYFYKITTPQGTIAKKMVIAR